MLNLLLSASALPVSRQRARTGLALLLACALSACDNPAPDVAPQRLVKTWRVTDPEPLPATNWTGTLEPAEQVSLHFRLDGRLATRPVDIGSAVKSGQTVATLSGALSREEAAAALAEYQDALAAETQGKQALVRVEKLYQIGTASKAQWEEARASLANLTARKIRAQAQRSGALNQSGFNLLTAPFDGVVTGFIPSPGQSVSAGQEVVKIASLTAEVEFTPASALAAGLKPGDELNVTINGHRTPARIRYISPVLDSATRTRLIRATLMAPEQTAAFGSVVTVAVKSTAPPAFSLPASCLTRVGNQPAVLIVDGHTGKVRSQTVKIARYTADNVWISQGVKAGDRVVTAGVNTLEVGTTVRMMPEVSQ